MKLLNNFEGLKKKSKLEYCEPGTLNLFSARLPQEPEKSIGPHSIQPTAPRSMMVT